MRQNRFIVGLPWLVGLVLPKINLPQTNNRAYLFPKFPNLDKTDLKTEKSFWKSISQKNNKE